MTRVKRGKISTKKNNKYLKLASGFKGLSSKSSTLASEQLIQSYNYQYIGRKLKKRNFKNLWIKCLSVKLKKNTIPYYYFSNSIKKNFIYINNKLLSFINLSLINSFLRQIC